MSDYLNDTQRFVNLGLNLRNSPDKVSQGQYTILSNASSIIEGSFTTRPGRTITISTGGSSVHTIRRISSSFLLLGVGNSLFRNGTIYPTSGYSGNPLSLVTYHSVVSPSIWAYIGDSNKLRKVNASGLDYKWGVTAPSTASSASAFGSGNLDSTVPGGIVYDWRYTYFSSVTGAESNPSPTMSTGISVAAQIALVSVAASDDPQIDTIKLYRRGGTNPNSWTLTATASNADANIQDNSADSAIALSKELELDNYVPFTSADSSGNPLYEVPLPYAWGPFVGKYILACGDSNRPGYVYWTNAERPDSSDTANNTTVTQPNEPLLNGFIYASIPYVWSIEGLYALDFGGPLAVPKFTPRKTPVGRGLSAPWAFAVGPLVYFLSKDGIYQTDCTGQAQTLTEETISPIFRGRNVENIEAVDYTRSGALRLFYANLKVHFLYKSITDKSYHLTYHILYNRWEQEETQGFSERSVYQDEKIPGTTVYVGGDNGQVYTIDGTTDAGVAIPVHIRTGSLDFNQAQTLKEFGNIIFDAAPSSGGITVTPYLNVEQDVLAPSTIAMASGRDKYPLTLSDTYAYSLAFDLTWTGLSSIYGYDILWRPDEEEVKHWEFPETSHGIMGWQHLKDIYLALRSISTTTLTITIDGAPFIYLLPSTAGERRKLHLYLDPIRGKMFRYALDSSTSFRLYGEDCEVRVKPWNTSMGYSLISPFIQARDRFGGNTFQRLT